ncbi:membrane protein [Agaricicola taiwanensis]|uniref:Membrane protein n=1 Tax=Agaricicola taiwanensis TaxID=591372 RepID=A0A8J2VI32_9RHOB|nr:TIGR02186 family protein [Agaricicola taiwanensis]GGE31448.1 membrane protein [Agaricicola taiwanensis]
MRLPALIAALVLMASPALAEGLTVSLSSHRIIIRSNFTGADVVLFGAIGRDASTISRSGSYDVVVTVRGPKRDIVVREKERILGFWVNWSSLTFPQIPDYLAISSSKPLAEIAGEAQRESLRLGLEESLPLPVSKRMPPEEVARNRSSLIRLKQIERRYIYNATGVTFLNEALFRATVPLPANVPIGVFEVEVKLFSGGALLATQNTALEVVKAGFEADMADVARERPWTYGFVAAFLAVACGWLASVAFRRD